MKDYEVVIIGAGNGGLMAAATLAKRGVNVLLLERHNVPGGCATSFCRGRYEFEVALHLLSGIGTPEKQGPLRPLLDEVGVLDKLEFLQMPDLYRITYPGNLDITLVPDRNEVVSELGKHFPDEKESIKKFYDLVYDFFNDIIKAFIFKDPNITPEKYPHYFKYALKTTQEVLDQFFKDPLLKLAITPFWGFLGLPPSSLPFNNLAGMLYSYIEFMPYHIKGGSQALSNALAEIIITNGGTIRYNCAAKKILVEKGNVRGVLTEDDEEISTGFVISNASKVATYNELIERSEVPESVFKEMKGASIGPSAVTIYMGVDCEPEDIGINSPTNFICSSADMDIEYEKMKVIGPDNPWMLLSCFNRIDPDFSPKGTSQLVLVTLKYGEPWLKIPPAQYTDEKYRCADEMLRSAEKVFPNLRNNIEEIEIATPITHLRYLGHPKGAIYGFDEQIKDLYLFVSRKSPLNGLFIAGSWNGQGGFQPTLESGASAARAVYRKLNTGE